MMPTDHVEEFGHGKSLYYLENAVITPTEIDVENRTFSGAVYDQSGHLVSISQRTSAHVAWKPTDPDQLPDNTAGSEMLDGNCIYLGHYSGHYGHFLLETLSRFWVLQENIHYDRLIFQPFIHDIPHPSVFSPAKVCFECFNIKPKQVVVVKKMIRCKFLIVPSPLVEINNCANPEQAAIYKQIAKHCEEVSKNRSGFLNKFLNPSLHSALKHHRFYLSRKKLRSPHYIKNEDEVEKIFRKFGFDVIYPESLDFRDQVALYNKAEILAGFAGSALHNSVFMNEGSLVITLGDLRSPIDSHPNQKLSDRLAGVRSIFVEFKGTTIDAIHKIGWFDINYLKDQLEIIL